MFCNEGDRPYALQAGPQDVAVLVNTGAKSTNVRDFLAIADGVIVGSDFKVDGHTWNPVNAVRVERFRASARV